MWGRGSERKSSDQNGKVMEMITEIIRESSLGEELFKWQMGESGSRKQRAKGEN